ncbi:MAG TPA: hypothetical protein VMR95_01280 [Candidatus Binatia bacterium]|jgi:hypothetical protein|nr:hypothetical protein [Candidatus Binatia bacterium]
MEFRHEAGTTPATRPVSQAGAANIGAAATQHKAGGGRKLGTWTKAGYTALLFATTLLVVAIAGLIAFSNNGQAAFINTSKFQAVFINDGSSNGQSVYFGHITKLTSSYLVLQDVYYITTPATTSGSTTAANSDYTLTQLGCQQLHDPYDQMIVNTSQIAFWENLETSGKVVSAITTYQKDNPNGPNCSEGSGTVGTTTNTQSTDTTQTAK